MQSKDKTVARSFRLSEKALQALEEEAEEQNTSVNTLENQLNVKYSEFMRYARRFNALYVSRGTFLAIVDITPEEELVRVARRMGKTAAPGYVNAKWGEVTPATVVEFIHDLGIYANWYEYHEARQNGKRTLTLMHELGNKWSLFLTHYLGEAFSLVKLNPSVSITERSVTFSL